MGNVSTIVNETFEYRRGDSPSETTKQVSLHATRRFTRDRPLPVRLILEHSREVSNHVDHTKDKAIFGAHRHVRPMCVSRDWRSGSSGFQEFVHFCGRADFGRCGVDGEDESEDDGEEDCCVSASRVD